MGTWGTGLYQSDVAADVRTVYRDCKKLGFSGSDLAAIVLETVGAKSADSEDGQLAHLALADLLSGLSRDTLLAMATKARGLARPHAAARVADELEKLAA